MAQRINPDTGYPMSNPSIIEKAKRNIEETKKEVAKKIVLMRNSDYGINEKLNDERATNTRKRALIYIYSAIPNAMAIAFYKEGNWDQAERKWFSVAYASYKIGDQLQKLYLKEKRYKDAWAITRATNFSADMTSALCDDLTSKKRLQKINDLYKLQSENSEQDKSTLPNWGEVLVPKFYDQISTMESRLFSTDWK